MKFNPQIHARSGGVHATRKNTNYSFFPAILFCKQMPFLNEFKLNWITLNIDRCGCKWVYCVSYCANLSVPPVPLSLSLRVSRHTNGEKKLKTLRFGRWRTWKYKWKLKFLSEQKQKKLLDCNFLNQHLIQFLPHSRTLLLFGIHTNSNVLSRKDSIITALAKTLHCLAVCWQAHKDRRNAKLIWTTRK